jgi:UDP-glucose 4-epimerase
MAHCLVTGGAGFIGSHLVEGLVAHGHRVRVLDDFSTGSLANLESVRHAIDVVNGDLADLNVVRSACRGIETVFHQAARASVPASVADPLATHLACATGTLHVLVAARAAGVRRVVYAASATAYGANGARPWQETDITQPLSPYAVAKLAGEEYCLAFATVYGLETVRLRYFYVFGPRQSPASHYARVIPLFIEAMLAGRPPMIHGDGQQSRDFISVMDVVQANVLAMEAPRVAGRVYNIASGRRTSINDLVARINEILGTRIEPVHQRPRTGLVRHGQADISRAQVELGFCPCVDLVQGLRQCITYYRSKQAATPRPDHPHKNQLSGVASRRKPPLIGAKD